MRGLPRIQEGSRSPWAGVVALGLAAGLGFLVPAVTVDLLAWSRPRLVGVLAVVVFSLVRGYTRSTGEAILPAGRRHWIAGVAVGALAGGVVVAHVLAQPSSPGPRGVGLVLAVVWLGVVYGTADSLLLSVLPVLATRHALAGWVRSGGPGRRGAAAGVALASSLAVTAAYHIGYPEYRGARLVSPLIGNAVLSLAYVVSGHPIATIGPHVAMHIAAVLHGPDTALQLPPHDSRR